MKKISILAKENYGKSPLKLLAILQEFGFIKTKIEVRDYMHAYSAHGEVHIPIVYDEKQISIIKKMLNNHDVSFVIGEES